MRTILIRINHIMTRDMMCWGVEFGKICKTWK